MCFEEDACEGGRGRGDEEGGMAGKTDVFVRGNTELGEKEWRLQVWNKIEFIYLKIVMLILV